MTVRNEKRFFKRCKNGAPVWLARFNTEYWLNAEALNHCTDGVCIKSDCYFQPGTTVLIRRNDEVSNGSGVQIFDGLPGMALGKVKWCREHSDSIRSLYDVGVKYFAPAY